MKNIDIKFDIKRIKIGLALTIVFGLILILEIYLAYDGLYSKLSTESETVEESNVVRVDLEAYNKTIELIDKLENFTPPNLILNNFNPFR
jgi:hypothetical protein